MKKQVVLLRVGIDAGCGGIQGPLFEDGTFEFVCIPDNKRVSVHNYGNQCGNDGRRLVDYFPESRRKQMADQHIHLDPEFETFTYGDPTTPKRSLRSLNPGDFLVFYCGLQEWDAVSGWKEDRRPALYLAGFFEVALAGMAVDFDKKTLESEFGKNFHVRYPSVFAQQKHELVLVKGGPGSRLFDKARQISVDGKDRAGKPLKVLSPTMQRVFGDFGGHVSIQRSPPRWVEPGFVAKAIGYLKDLKAGKGDKLKQWRFRPAAMARKESVVMPQIQIEFPVELLGVPGQSQSSLAHLAQEAFLVRLYDLGQISSGRAAEILRISRREFLDILNKYGVSLFDEEVDLEVEARCGR